MGLVETRLLTKIYGNRHIAVNSLSLSVGEGWVFGLLGPNGAGKTTLLKLLMGLQAPTAGIAELFGKRMTVNATHLRRRIGYLPTNPKFPPTMTPLTYLDLVARLHGQSREERKPRIASLIRAVDLIDAAGKPIRSFSTGMTTRLGMAASLVNDPDLLIWDEPTSGLDPAGRKYALDLIRELGQAKTVIVSSHILSDIDRVCSHVGIMLEGNLIFHGSVSKLKQTIDRNSVEIEVDGPEPLLAEFRRRLEMCEEVSGIQRNGSWFEVRFQPDRRLAAPLGRLFAVATEMEIDVCSVSSTRGQTEDAFISLLEADHVDKFSRSYGVLPAVPKDDDRGIRPLPG